MSSSLEKNCTFTISTEKHTPATQDEICKDLESNVVENKIRYVIHIIFFIFLFIILVNFL